MNKTYKERIAALEEQNAALLGKLEVRNISNDIKFLNEMYEALQEHEIEVVQEMIIDWLDELECVE